MKVTIGLDRIGVRPTSGSGPRCTRPGYCPDDAERGVFRGMALVCPRCGRFLGGI